MSDDRYQIIERIGSGGMGVVYKARDTRLNRVVALKFLPESIDSDQQARARFTHEARAASALEHPNVCTIFEIGESDEGRLYIAMPFYEGETLRDRLTASPPLSLDNTLRIGAQIARGLAAAHDVGITHRDIKAANILLAAERAVILDFGLAKLETGTLLTKEGATLGTIAYMSPEQARGGDVTTATDVWALGVLLYEMVAGTRPFRGDYDQAVIYGILNEVPQPLAVKVPSTPQELSDLVGEMLSKDISDRPSARTVASRLDAVSTGKTQSTPGTKAHAGAAPRRVGRLALAGIGLLFAGLLGWFLTRAPTDTEAAVIDSIAVLPMKNMSGDDDQEYFADGLTEELISTLGQVTNLKVAARTSSFSFKGKELDVREVGRRLGVKSILDGSVRRSGETLRVTAQLVDIEGGFALWSNTYERRVSDVFAIQEDIARSIVEALQATLTTDGSSPLAATDNVAAFEAYMRGLFYWNRRTEDGLRRAVDYFKEAIETAPGYAKAHAGLAHAYCIMGFYDWMPPSEAFPRCRSAAEETLRLDGDSPDALAALAYVALYYEWDPVAAESAFKSAIESDPRYSTAYQWYSNLLVATGRADRGWEQMNHAYELDPLSLVISAARGWVSCHAGKNARGRAELEAAAEMDSTFGLAYLWRSICMDWLQDPEPVLALTERAVRLSGRSPFALATQAYVLARAGREEQAALIVEELEGAGPEHYVPPFDLAKAHLALGNEDEAYRLFDKALADRSHAMVFLTVDPQLEAWRDQPRFQDLVRRVGFARSG